MQIHFDHPIDKLKVIKWIFTLGQSKWRVTCLNQTIRLKVIVESTFDGRIVWLKSNVMPLFLSKSNWFLLISFLRVPQPNNTKIDLSPILGKSPITRLITTKLTQNNGLLSPRKLHKGPWAHSSKNQKAHQVSPSKMERLHGRRNVCGRVLNVPWFAPIPWVSRPINCHLLPPSQLVTNRYLMLTLWHSTITTQRLQWPSLRQRKTFLLHDYTEKESFAAWLQTRQGVFQSAPPQ